MAKDQFRQPLPRRRNQGRRRTLRRSKEEKLGAGRDIYDSERGCGEAREYIEWAWAIFPPSSISVRLRDSLRLDGGVNIVNIAVGSPARYFASRKTGIRVAGNDRDVRRGPGQRIPRVRILLGRRVRKSVNVRLPTR